MKHYVVSDPAYALSSYSAVMGLEKTDRASTLPTMENTIRPCITVTDVIHFRYRKLAVIIELE